MVRIIHINVVALIFGDDKWVPNFDSMCYKLRINLIKKMHNLLCIWRWSYIMYHFSNPHWSTTVQIKYNFGTTGLLHTEMVCIKFQGACKFFRPTHLYQRTLLFCYSYYNFQNCLSSFEYLSPHSFNSSVATSLLPMVKVKCQLSGQDNNLSKICK